MTVFGYACVVLMTLNYDSAEIRVCDSDETDTMITRQRVKLTVSASYSKKTSGISIIISKHFTVIKGHTKYAWLNINLLITYPLLGYNMKHAYCQNSQDTLIEKHVYTYIKTSMTWDNSAINFPPNLTRIFHIIVLLKMHIMLSESTKGVLRSFIYRF